MENEASQLVNIDNKERATDNPLISIITQVLNGINYLEACIQSVLNQGYPYIEHIFIDGGSTDGTLEMLSSYQAKYPDQIRFISEPDKGACDAWNKGLRMARGEILGWLGADDMSEPGAIQTVVSFFKANPDAYFVFGDCKTINELDEVIGKSKARGFDLEKSINDGCCVPCPSAFYRRQVVEKVGFMDTTIHACDLDYWIRVGKVFQLHRIDSVLSNFRIHKDSVSSAPDAARTYRQEGFIICRRHGGGFFSPRVRKYYTFLIIDWLRPVLGFAYPLIRKILRQ